MTTAALRKAYLDFFSKKHGHAVIQGASLIPENDPTVLFTTAGMHPLVPYLMGEAHPSGKRLVNVQRCIRTQDIDEVGDASHLTCFEMLGNWSLGDYFKEESIAMSFEFLTEVLEIPVEKLAITCFEGDSDAPKDEESADIWKSHGIPAERIAFLNKKENWWGPAGATGPCGPDTEIFYWVGEGEPHGNPGTNEKDWLEIWNNVFMEYDKQVKPDKYEEYSKLRLNGMPIPPDYFYYISLEKKCVDTGMGLERMAQVLQGVENVYETDVLKDVMNKVEELWTPPAIHANKDDEKIWKRMRNEHFDKPETIRFQRIITDHIKAAVFIISDGIHPLNVDQGYVLRKLIRRVIRSARQIDPRHVDNQYCWQIAHIIIDNYKSAYPVLEEKKDEIFSVLDLEEKKSQTICDNPKQFNKQTADLNPGDEIDGQSAFHLYDTYGFPLERTKEMAEERGLTVDEVGFHKKFEEHQALSRAGAEKKFSGGLADHSSETTKLHTATHLLNAGLRKVLGDHISQKGSNITAERLRFDFNHPEKVTREQLDEVERLVNEQIAADHSVSYHITTVEGAKEEGAVGVFDDRYGDEVKVYQIGDGSFSKEICGGPHVARTGMIGEFKIKKEESSSAGVRRIKAMVSGGPEEIEVAVEVPLP